MRLPASRAVAVEENFRGGDLLCFEQNFAALLSTCHFQIASAFYHEFTSGFYHPVYHFVVVTRVMMKQHKRLNLRFKREGNGAGDRTVSPADVPLIFLVGILRVENQNIAAAQKFDQRSVLVRRNLFRLFRTQLFSTRRVEKKFIRLVSGEKSNCTTTGENSITNTDAGMIYERCMNVQFPERELHLVQFVNVHFRGELTHCDRKERRFHRLGHDLAERRPGAIKAENANFVFGIVRWLEKWEALDVVPVRVSNQQQQPDRSRLEFSVKSDTKRPDARARVEHNNLALGSQFYA